MMLPLEDAVVADALRRAASALRRTLWEGTSALPASVDGGGEGGEESLCKLELVPSRVLISR